MIKGILAAILSLFKTYKKGDSVGNLPSPRVNIQWADIEYDDINNCLKIYGIEPALKINTVQNTNSMEPLLDVGHIIVRSNAPKYLDNLDIGDIIVWSKDGKTIIHSIVSVGEDALGWFCRTQGLNIPRPDPEKIRREDIIDVALMVIWCKGEGAYTPTPVD